MSTKSVTVRIIDAIISKGPAPLLKANGYRKLARSFHSEADGMYRVVQFQASMWNTPDSAEFTINLNIVLPYFHGIWTTQAFPKNPASAAPILSERIGMLMPKKRDFWWKVTPKSDIEQISADVTQALSKFGLPFLDKHSKLEALIRVAQHKPPLHQLGANEELCLAILLAFQGKHSKAARLLRELAKNNKHEGFAETIRSTADDLGLRLAD